jgi:hypothetical protein
MKAADIRSGLSLPNADWDLSHCAGSAGDNHSEHGPQRRQPSRSHLLQPSRGCPAEGQVPIVNANSCSFGRKRSAAWTFGPTRTRQHPERSAPHQVTADA